MGQKLALRVPPLAQIVVTAVVMWLAAQIFPAWEMAWLYTTAVAVLLALSGAAISALGVAEFRQHKTSVDPLQPEKAERLVTSGVYRFSRNPMYVGFALALLGWAIYLVHPLPLLVWPLFVIYITRFQIVPEERFMVEKFGDDFRTYQAQTRRWL